MYKVGNYSALFRLIFSICFYLIVDVIVSDQKNVCFNILQKSVTHLGLQGRHFTPEASSGSNAHVVVFSSENFGKFRTILNSQ